MSEAVNIGVKRDTRFKKGNPGGPGRPAYADIVKETFKKIFDEDVTVGKDVKMKRIEVFLRGLVGSDNPGDRRLVLEYFAGKPKEEVDLSHIGEIRITYGSDDRDNPA